jgi:hypothetical protein
MRKRHAGALVGGVSLLLIGGWLGAVMLGAPLLGPDRLWPVIPMVSGLALLAQYARPAGQGRGAVLVGVTVLLSGLFLSLFTLQIANLTWYNMLNWWPVFMVIVGAAFLAVYLHDDLRNPSLVIPVYLFGGFGLAALLFTTGFVGSVAFAQVIKLWPLLVLFMVAIFFFGFTRNTGEGPDIDEW